IYATCPKPGLYPSENMMCTLRKRNKEIRPEDGNRLLHRHFPLYWLQSLRGGVQTVEPAPDDGYHFSGMSYDNTVALGASTWRHVSFIERPVPITGAETGLSWLMASDV